MTLPMPILRRTLLELGRRLAEAGILEAAEDVFHLRFDELESIDGVWPPPADIAEELRKAARRRADRRHELERAGTPLMDLPSLTGPQPGEDVLVVGTPGSPGVAEGPVRIVRDPAAFGSLRPGEVLVAPTRTRPGRRSSRAPPPLSSIPAPPCRTRPSWRGSMGFPR